MMTTEQFSRSIPFLPDPQQRANVLEKSERAAFEQPILDHERWFLNANEMRTARDGFERPTHALFTTGNHVKIYPASAGYFSDVADDIAQTREHDLVYIAGWSVCNVPFKPLDSSSTLHELVKGSVTRGADVRMLIWSNLTERKQVVEVRDFVNALPPPKKSGPARFVFDDRLPHPTSSHHQKSVVVRKGRELIAYVGGVDLTSNRWDTLEHDQHQLRQQTYILKDKARFEVDNLQRQIVDPDDPLDSREREHKGKQGAFSCCRCWRRNSTRDTPAASGH
ncbi:phospholipase D-like protein [Phytophthora cinnamomi]|uniref:phospholipase D-like protein n=1 Tax=Phytophthora cinnamomi TaxID=4785 RepID=UPI00355A07D4|nr:phospholipase D-like protein [Phytophthora cinnamomi]